MAKETNKQVAPEGEERKKAMPFGRQNYIMVLIGVAVIALGFILMIGGGSTDPDFFNEKMFDFRRITLAPVLVLAGFVIEIVAIFWRGKE